ncbi:protein-tyrosine phosphatase-like protein [Aspergillus unguis]
MASFSENKNAGTSVEIDGVYNVRSFGGYRSSADPSLVTRNGFIYRSGHLKDVTTRGVEQIKDLGITTIIDLTGSNEVKALFTESESPLGQFKVHNFALVKHGFSVQQLAEKYRRYVEEGGRAIAEGYFKLLVEGHEVIRDILLLIRDNPNEVFLVHCAMGKDRTGVIFAVLLSLAGLSNDLIAEEYSRSEAALELSLPLIAAAIKKAMPAVTDEDALAKAKIAIQTRKDAMLFTLEMIEKQFRDMKGYLTDCCGIDLETIKRTQDVLTQQG